MASTGLSSLDQLLGSGGYPDKSTIMVVGPPGIGKEAIGYWITQFGLMQKDFCFNVTRLPAREVLQGVKAFGIDVSQNGPFWFKRRRCSEV